jgi:hypothetical protein
MDKSLPSHMQCIKVLFVKIKDYVHDSAKGQKG